LYGATTVLMPKWDVARFFSLLEGERVQHAFTIGPHAPSIAGYPDAAKHDLSSLQLTLTLIGAEPIERGAARPATNMYGITAGRTRDNIQRGGEKFGTEDIELLLARHPQIADGKVVAMPDPIYGEKACAYLIPRDGADLPSVPELAAFLVSHGLAKYKCPERIEAVPTFPVTRVGKLDRQQLRQAIAEKLAAETQRR